MKSSNIVVHKPKSNKAETLHTLQPQVVKYDMNGEETLEDESSINVLAKTFTGLNGLVSYYVRSDSNNHLHNHLNYLKNVRADKKTKMKKVSKQCFELYMKFLISKNKLWLNKAERSIV